MPLKYLSNFWRLFGIPLINYKVDLKLNWTKYYILSAAGADNNNGNVNDTVSGNNITFTIKDTKLYVPVVTLPSKDNHKLSKFLH